jgi:hypothetical protein
MPGPNAYDERKFLLNKYSAPKYSFGKRIPTSLGQDPYVNTLPSIFYFFVFVFTVDILFNNALLWKKRNNLLQFSFVLF